MRQKNTYLPLYFSTVVFKVSFCFVYPAYAPGYNFLVFFLIPGGGSKKGNKWRILPSSGVARVKALSACHLHKPLYRHCCEQLLYHKITASLHIALYSCTVVGTLLTVQS